MTKPTFIECNKQGYPARTAVNVSKADWNFIAYEIESYGEKLTSKLIERIGGNWFKVCITDFDAMQFIETVSKEVHKFQTTVKPDNNVVNVAGNGIYNLRYEQQHYDDLFTLFFERLLKMGCLKSTTKIISGGQTGIDQSAIIAAMKNDLHCEINAPKDWMFRTEKGIDVCSIGLFMARFDI